MTSQYSRYWMFAALVFSVGGIAAARAAEASLPASADKPASDPPPAAEEVTVLPPLEVTARRKDPLAKELRQHDREAAGEKTAEAEHRGGLFSRVFNGWKLPFFTSKLTADRLAEGAARRGEILDLERGLIVALHQAETKQEKRALKADLAALRELRRATTAADARPFSP